MIITPLVSIYRQTLTMKFGTVASRNHHAEIGLTFRKSVRKILSKKLRKSFVNGPHPPLDIVGNFSCAVRDEDGEAVGNSRITEDEPLNFEMRQSLNDFGRVVRMQTNATCHSHALFLSIGRFPFRKRQRHRQWVASVIVSHPLVIRSRSEEKHGLEAIVPPGSSHHGSYGGLAEGVAVGFCGHICVCCRGDCGCGCGCGCGRAKGPPSFMFPHVNIVKGDVVAWVVSIVLCENRGHDDDEADAESCRAEDPGATEVTGRTGWQLGRCFVHDACA
mmetsp:Transcript_12753/g.27148  ORF Transcript_12753/g.27148 Transcript_12753/m.27148 type:complete len:275 (-) Transcript_12753:25-849(-)